MVTPNEKLEAARMRKRWSIAVASERAGVSINTFNRWERGLQVPQLGTLDQVCKAFELSPEELGFGHAITAKRRTQAVVIKAQPPAGSTTAAFHHSPAFTPLPRIGTPVVSTTHQQTENELHACVEQVKRSLESMTQEQNKRDGDEGVSRRQAIATLIGTPAIVFGLTPGASPTLLHPEEVLSLCMVNIPLSWQLYFEGGLTDVERVLPGYLTQLTTLAQQSSPYQGRAASLASQGYQLASLVALQHQNYGIAQTYAQQAFDYGEQINDPNLQTASLIRQAQVHFYLKRPVLRLRAYERALHYSKYTSPLLQGRVYIGLTEVHSKLDNEREAEHFLDLAQNTFPEKFEADPNFSYTHFNYWSLSSFEGMMHINLKKPKQAWEAFMQVDKVTPRGSVPNRLELTVRQANAAYALSDRDQTCAYVESAAKSALSIGNQLRLDEAYDVFEQMQKKWGSDRKVKALGELFR